jgi:uncharacterized protein with HEPN domain
MKSELGDKQRIKHIIDAGEAASTISKGFKETHMEFDWLLMKGMRNIIVHEYFGVDERKLWDTVMNDVPKLVTDSENALKDFE